MCRRILIIEDERIVARHLQHVVRKLGHVPIGHAASGADAIRMAAESLPDLILMDIQLEGNLDGVDAAREITRARFVPIVYITANVDVFMRNPGKMAFPFLCIAKPFSVANVKAAIEGAFELG